MRVCLMIVRFGFIFICAVSGASQTNLYGERWELIELNGKSVADSRVFIQFDETTMKLSGNGGCNRFFGNYWRGAEELAVWDLGVSQNMCPGLDLMAR